MDNLILQDYTQLPDGNTRSIYIYTTKIGMRIKEMIITPKDICILERELENTYLIREVTYYDSGKTKSIYTFNKLGKVEGKCYEFYESGNIKQEAHYINGKPTKVWHIFTESGTVKNTAHYINGRLVGSMFPITEMVN